MNKETLCVIDGNSVLNRAFFGLMGNKMLMTKDGLYTNAIYGFLSIMQKLLNEDKPDYICVAFDLKAPTFRHLEYDKYKAQRKGMPEELRPQVPVIKELLDAMNIKRFECEGFEADDLIGTLAKHFARENKNVTVFTGDKDALQLIDDNITVKLPTTKMGKTEVDIYNADKVMERYGITPIQIIDFKGLMGDPSDNIPGVRGVGEKTALDLIKKFGSVEDIYEDIENKDIKPRIKENLINEKDTAYLSKRLATINTQSPIDICIEDIKLKEVNKQKLLELFKRLEFKSFIEKFNLKEEEKPVENKTVETEVKILEGQEIDSFIKHLDTVEKFSYYLYPENQKQSIPNHLGICIQDKTYVMVLENKKELLEKIFTSKPQKCGHNIKNNYILFRNLGFEAKNVVFDTMIASYILKPSIDNTNLSEVSQDLLGRTVEYTAKKNTQLSLLDSGNNDEKELIKYISDATKAIYDVTNIMTDELEKNGQHELYFDVEFPLIGVLADMEIEGILINQNILEDYSFELSKKVDALIGEIYSLSGVEFNINSPKQLGEVLFEKLGLPTAKKIKTGYSTNVEVLESLVEKHPVVEKLLLYRQLMKLKSTYVEGLRGVINPVTHRIHSSFNQTITQTGRISSTEPNLQNIPVKLEAGKQIRKFFEAKEDFVFVDADYSQIELRVLAHIADDKNMKEAFNNNVDIHTKTASQVFNVPIEQVTSFMRSSAKAVNFGIVYGISDFGLGKDIGVSRKKAKEYIDSYLENFSGVRQYMSDIVEKGKEDGYVTTLLNRRRYLPELKSTNFNIRSFGQRIAMNTPIQGTAADIIKIAMVRAQEMLKEKKLKSRLILQVHDELIIEAHKDEVEQVTEILRDAMEGALDLTVPLKVDIKSGKSWYDTK